MACVSACRYIITDAAAVELANYEASSETQELIVDSAWTVWIVEDGVATEGTSDQIVVGDVMIIYTDSDGVENIVVYHLEEDDSDETDEGEDNIDDETTDDGDADNDTTNDENGGTQTDGGDAETGE